MANKAMFGSNAHQDYDQPALAEGRREGARPHVDKAAELVHKTGYVRRDGEVSDLKEKRGR